MRLRLLNYGPQYRCASIFSLCLRFAIAACITRHVIWPLILSQFFSFNDQCKGTPNSNSQQNKTLWKELKLPELLAIQLVAYCIFLQEYLQKNCKLLQTQLSDLMHLYTQHYLLLFQVKILPLFTIWISYLQKNRYCLLRSQNRSDLWMIYSYTLKSWRNQVSSSREFLSSIPQSNFNCKFLNGCPYNSTMSFRLLQT